MQGGFSCYQENRAYRCHFGSFFARNVDFPDSRNIVHSHVRSLICITLKTPVSHCSNMDFTYYCTFSQCEATFASSFDLSERQNVCKYRLKYCKLRKTATEGRPSTNTITSSHKNAEFSKVPCMADCLDKCKGVPAEEVSSKTLNGEMQKQNHVMNAAEILLWISREFSKRFLKEALHFLQSPVLTSADYINELPTLTKCKRKLEIFVCDRLIGIKMIPKVKRSTGCAGVEECDQMYRNKL